MLATVKSIIKKTPLALPFIWAKRRLVAPWTQNEEGDVLDTLVSRHAVPHSFIEFGFGGWEFTCARLARTWSGLLLDGDAYNVRIAKVIHPSSITAVQTWITRDTLSIVKDWAKDRAIGVLSVDVDGNDYWFLSDLLDSFHPAIIVAEYNSVFGRRSITVPYADDFQYRSAHPSHFYWGTSLRALSNLTKRHGYVLIDVPSSGINAFFIRAELLGPDDTALDPDTAFRERDWKLGKRMSEQWREIEHMPFVTIDN